MRKAKEYSELRVLNAELPAEVVEDVKRLWKTHTGQGFNAVLRLYGIYPLYSGQRSFETENGLYVEFKRRPLFAFSASGSGMGGRLFLAGVIRPLDSLRADLGIFPRGRGLRLALNRFRTRLEYSFTMHNPGLNPRGLLSLFNLNCFKVREWELLPQRHTKGIRWIRPSWPQLMLYYKEDMRDFVKLGEEVQMRNPRSLTLRAKGELPQLVPFQSFDAKVKLDLGGEAVGRCSLRSISILQGSWSFVNYVRLQRSFAICNRPHMLLSRLKDVYVFEAGKERVRAVGGALGEVGWRVQSAVRPFSFFAFCAAACAAGPSFQGQLSFGGGLRIELTSEVTAELLLRGVPTPHGVYPCIFKFHFRD